MKIGIFYGTSTGNSKYVGDLLAAEFGNEVETYNVQLDGISAILDCDLIILGASTMENNDITEAWERHLSDFGVLDLSGKKVAIYGLGNQEDYPDNFIDAVEVLYKRAKAVGATMIGHWPTDGYDYRASKAEIDGKFMGLAIDEDVQPDQTKDRVKAWAAQLKQEA